MDDMESNLNRAMFVAVEAMFELFAFDLAVQKDFEESLDNLSEEYYSISV